MHFEAGKIYHVYNRGNNKQPIFFSEENYLFFLKKVDQYLKPSADILWLLSSYAKAINKAYYRTGNLFQQKTRSKCVMDGTVSNALTVFHHIHQNALRAGMVKKMEDWSFSSFQDYLGIRQGKLCRKI
ncbi:MAG: hypothetical protein ABIQ74_10955 [Chitinophagales bacterium]